MSNMDFLKPILGDELYGKFVEAVQEKGASLNLVDISDGKFIPKAKFDEKLEAIKKLESDLTAAGEQVKTAQAQTAGLGALNDKVAQLTKDLQDKDKQLTDISNTYAIKDVVRAKKARDVDIVMGLLDRKSITVKEGKVTGIDEQIDKLVKEKPFLFDRDEPEQAPASRGGYQGKQDLAGAGGGKSTNQTVNDVLRRMAGHN